jgi:beta-ureidopropionase / N-carbamoyl-L-amino-acid hydrolase
VPRGACDQIERKAIPKNCRVFNEFCPGGSYLIIDVERAGGPKLARLRTRLGRCPTGMIFIPCRDGLSHVEEEKASPEHVAAGARVLAEILIELANSAD